MVGFDVGVCGLAVMVMVDIPAAARACRLVRDMFVLRPSFRVWVGGGEDGRRV